VCLAAALRILAAHSLPRWPLFVSLVAALFLGIRPWLPTRLDRLLFALPFATLPFLDLYALFGIVVPMLSLPAAR
jgi:hypothetical protein